MRRLLSSLAALGLVSVVLGCHHTAGMCDCDICNDMCTYGPAGTCGGCGGAGSVGSPGTIHGTGIPQGPSGAPGLIAEPIKAMPKEKISTPKETEK
jgi:hypothetical protein